MTLLRVLAKAASWTSFEHSCSTVYPHRRMDQSEAVISHQITVGDKGFPISTLSTPKWRLLCIIGDHVHSSSIIRNHIYNRPDRQSAHEPYRLASG